MQDQIKLSGVTNLIIGTYKLEQPQENKNGGKAKMLKLTKHLNLQELADEDAIISAVMAIQKDLEAAMAKIKAVTEQRDQAVEEAEGLSKKIEDAELEAHEKEKEEFFDSAIKAGQLEINESEDWKLQYDKDPAFVTKMINLKEKKTTGQKTLNTNTKVKALSKADREILESEGIDPDDPKNKEKIKYVLEGVA